MKQNSSDKYIYYNHLRKMFSDTIQSNQCFNILHPDVKAHICYKYILLYELYVKYIKWNQCFMGVATNSTQRIKHF